MLETLGPAWGVLGTSPGTETSVRGIVAWATTVAKATGEPEGAFVGGCLHGLVFSVNSANTPGTGHSPAAQLCPPALGQVSARAMCKTCRFSRRPWAGGGRRWGPSQERILLPRQAQRSREAAAGSAHRRAKPGPRPF